jgi:segregation and condensation protein A
MLDDWSKVETPPVTNRDDAAFILKFESYEGPIDLLLEQAREQKVDLTQISILALANQYLAFVEHARRLSLELAAHYLVMAAWLAYLKSRLLLPVPPDDDEPSGAELAEALAFQLRRLNAMREAGLGLMALPQLGHDRFPRGAAEDEETVVTSVWAVSLYDLLKAYADHHSAKAAAEGGLRIEASLLHSPEQALERMEAMLGRFPNWTTLAAFLPPMTGSPLVRRSALAATFVATLELAKAGRLAIRQDGLFGQIWLKAQTPPVQTNDDVPTPEE